MNLLEDELGKELKGHIDLALENINNITLENMNLKRANGSKYEFKDLEFATYIREEVSADQDIFHRIGMPESLRLIIKSKDNCKYFSIDQGYDHNKLKYINMDVLKTDIHCRLQMLGLTQYNREQSKIKKHLEEIML